jgi:hypothetical protein
MQPIYISGYNKGLQNNKKPFLLPDEAFPNLQNAYVWRDRVKKREGLRLLGRLRRNLTGFAAGNYSTINGTNTFQIFNTLSATEPHAEVVPGNISNITITIGAPVNKTLTDTTGTGVMTLAGAGPITAARINYATGTLTITATAALGPAAVTATISYYPSLPVMGIWQRERSVINDEETIFFDTKYAYRFSAGSFQEFITGTTWAGTDSDFFWATNYRGSVPENRLFFATNFVCDANNPMRYTDGTTWTSFAPIIADNPPSAAQSTLFQARILIPYYGRLLALNTWEGTTAGGYAAAVNIFNRCRFSQVGNPVATDAWRSDQFGKGGFIDAPTSESIVSATFFKNTLIVFFERSTWQLRYQGDYGIPFIWERISSDFGSESTFSTVLFDQGLFSVGDRAIISANAVTVDRIDLAIPDIVFTILNRDDGVYRVQGVRNFQKEIVYWSYPDSNSLETDQYFPNKVLILNYRNNTYAIFRDSVTAFGTFQPSETILWSNTLIKWKNTEVLWDDVDTQSQFPDVVAGNQQGFVHYYANQLPDDESLSVTGINLSVTPITLTIPNHNLEDGEIIYLSAMIFSGASTDLNDQIYRAAYIDKDTISLSKWDSANQQYIDNFSFTPVAGTPYLGLGVIAIFPRMQVETKDFNPYQTTGGQAKLCYIDFLVDVPYDDDGTEILNGAMSVVLFANSSPAVVGNLLVGNQKVETSATLPYYVPASDYAWHRFYATLAAQYFRILMTYDDDLMNDIDTHSQDWILNAITLYIRPGGKIVF